MMRPLLFVALLALAATAGAEETVVYKVKNPDGTYSYSQDPVEGAERRVVGSSGSSRLAAPETPAAAAEAPDEVQAGSVELDASRSEACATATANLAVYGSGDSVTIAAGDGEPQTLTGDALVAARARAQREVDAYCPKTTGA